MQPHLEPLRPAIDVTAGCALTLSIVDATGEVLALPALPAGETRRVPPHRHLAVDADVVGSAHDLVDGLALATVDRLVARLRRGARDVGGAIARLASLRALSVAGGGILADDDVAALGRLEHVDELVLGSAWRLTAAAWASIARHPRLRVLGLPRCGGIADEGIDALGRLDGLRAVDLSFTGVTAAGLQRLRLPLVEALAVRQVPLSRAAFAHLATWPRLAALDVSWCGSLAGVEAVPARVAVTTTAPDIVISHLDGSCPVLAWGTVGGQPFAFRARWDRWSFEVGDRGQAVFALDEPWGSGPCDAGSMDHDAAEVMIHRAARAYLAAGSP